MVQCEGIVSLAMPCWLLVTSLMHLPTLSLTPVESYTSKHTHASLSSTCIPGSSYMHIFVEPASGKARQLLQFLFSVCACDRPSGFVRAITSTYMHGFQNNYA